MLYNYLLVLVTYTLYNSKPSSGWDIPSGNQYHIQTDEGPERYFRYQTDSGQFRKEKRLEDGTVVGTYAWIDDNGFLQQRDYIADNSGYRILKTINSFVGRNIPIGQAMKSISKYRASVGSLNSNQKTVPYKIASSYSPTPSSPPGILYGDRFPASISSTTPSNIVTSTEAPIVEITPIPVYSTSAYPLNVPLNNVSSHSNGDNYISSTPFPTSSLPPTYYQSTTPSLSTPYVSSTQRPYNIDSQSYASHNDISKEVNSLEYNPYVNQIDSSYRFHNGPTYPLDKSGRPYFGQNLDTNYDPQYSNYDGASVTNDGFRYYIPRAYHEEETLPGNKRSGSFGYIDPFGIRRVIYYNTAPGTGFQHRKNNRYVGFQATPYDPRPY